MNPNLLHKPLFPIDKAARNYLYQLSQTTNQDAYERHRKTILRFVQYCHKRNCHDPQTITQELYLQYLQQLQKLHPFSYHHRIPILNAFLQSLGHRYNLTDGPKETLDPNR